MHILLDLLHLVAAAVLSLVGFGYEREEECPPVRFLPSAYVSEAEAGLTPPVAPAGLDAATLAAADCEPARVRLTLPAL